VGVFILFVFFEIDFVKLVFEKIIVKTHYYFLALKLFFTKRWAVLIFY